MVLLEIVFTVEVITGATQLDLSGRPTQRIPPSAGLQKQQGVVRWGCGWPGHDLNTDCSSYQIGNKIYDLCQLFDLEQLVTSPTRQTISSPTIIDVILSNLGARHTLTDVTHICLSDHYII